MYTSQEGGAGAGMIAGAIAQAYIDLYREYATSVARADEIIASSSGRVMLAPRPRNSVRRFIGLRMIIIF